MRKPQPAWRAWIVLLAMFAMVGMADPAATDAPPPRSALPLTTAERLYLAGLPPLRVVYDPRFAPFTRQDSGGQAEGLSRDYLADVAGQLGLRLQFVASPSLENTRRLIANDAVDLVLAFNPRGRAGTGLTFTRPYIEFPLVIATRDDTRSLTGIDDLGDRPVAANLEREAVLRLLATASTPPKVLSVPDTATGLSWLAAGKVDAMVGNLAAVDALIRSRYPQLRTGAPTGLTEPLSFAVVPRMAPLAPLLDRALARVDSRERQRIANTWLSVRYVYADLPALLLQKATPYLLTLLPVAVVALYFLFGLVRERRRRRQTELQLADVTMNLPAVVYRFHVAGDGSMHFLYIGGDPSSIFGLTAQAMIADEPAALATVHPDDRAVLVEGVINATRTLTPLHCTVRVSAHGGLLWVTSHGVPRRLRNGDTEFNGYWIDVTEQHAQADALAQAKDAAESATRAKTEFLTTMSHEIRTPMNGVLGMLELLADTPLNDEQRGILDTAGESAEALLHILSDILDFSKIEAGKLALAPVPTDIRHVVDSSVAILASGAHAKALDVVVDIDAAVAASLLVDGARLRQVLVNLVSNAIKFTATGTVAVTIVVSDDNPSTQLLQLVVSDTGIGVDAATLAGLFTPFTQAEASTSRRFGGTGLGLVICRRLVELMGGEIGMHSAPGQGTQVTVTLPMTIYLRDRAPTVLRGHTAAIHLADDRSARALGHYLAAHGVAVVSPDGTADITFVDDLASAAIDFAIKVSHTPDPRGFHWRQELLVATDNPWRWGSMQRLLESALGLGHEPDQPQPHSSVSALAPRAGRVLVADDHPTNRALVHAQLSKLGYACDLVVDGQAALAALASGRYAMLIVDCQMPVIDGYTVAARWRETEAGSALRLPIVAMTANAMVGESARCMAAGMDDFLTKPTNLRSLRDALLRWMPDVDNPTNLTVMQGHFGDAAVVRAIGHEFLAVTQADLAALDERTATVDTEDLYQLVHRMMGAMMVFGRHPVMAAGDALLHYLDEATDADAARAAFRAWRHQLEEFLAALERWLDDVG